MLKKTHSYSHSNKKQDKFKTHNGGITEIELRWAYVVFVHL